MAQNIFDDSDLEEGFHGTADLQINQSYAKRFEHNKKREALQRLEEMKKNGLVSDSDESSEQELEDDPWSTKMDVQFFNTLIKVKNNDPIIYQKDAKFYSEDEEEDEDKKAHDKREEREKPMYLKDVVAKQLLEDGPDFGEEQSKPRESQSKVYSREQEENLKAFREAVDDALGDNDDDLFEMEKSKAVDDDENELNLERQRKIEEFWGDDVELDEKELFMKRFFLNKMWVDKGKLGDRLGDLHPLSEDEEALEEQEKFEREYNFRYEEGAGDRILGHARHVEGSVRKKKNSRKRQRKNKEERMLQAQLERKEELKHLKNLKRKEIEERLVKVRAIAGIGDESICKLTKDDLEEEFDPEEYDRKMKEMFNMDYYNADDADPEFGSGADYNLVQPNFNEEDEFLGLPKDWDVIETGAGFKAARDRSLKQKADEKGAEDVEEGKLEDDAEEDQQYERKRKRKHKISLQEKVELQKELDEYYKLDYEDTIGDLRTRFKYKSVPSNNYGLNVGEILMTDDKELNQYVSLKKLAPYVEKEWKVPKSKLYQMKKKMCGGEWTNNGGKTKKRNANHSSRTEQIGKTQQDVSPCKTLGEKPPSKRSKKRRRQAQIKLTHSRLLAYGKMSPKPKKQKKQKH